MSVRDLVNLAGADLVAEPVAHFVKDGFLEPQRFAALRDSFPGRDAFAAPEVARFAGGRSDLEPGMEGYRRFLAATPVWRDCMAQLHSRAYAEFLLDVFAPSLRALSKWRAASLAPHPDSAYLRRQRPLGAALARAARAIPGPRLDRFAYRGISRLRGRFFPDGYAMICAIACAWDGYAQPAHRDTPDRIIVNLVYFNDPVRDGGGRGGQFRLYRPQPGARLRDGIWATPEQVRPLLRAAPRANLGVGLLNAPGLLHSGEAFAAGSQPRRFLYLALSKCDPPYPW